MKLGQLMQNLFSWSECVICATWLSGQLADCRILNFSAITLYFECDLYILATWPHILNVIASHQQTFCMHSHCLTFLRTLSTAADETNNIWMCFQHFHHLKLLRIVMVMVFILLLVTMRTVMMMPMLMMMILMVTSPGGGLSSLYHLPTLSKFSPPRCSFPSPRQYSAPHISTPDDNHNNNNNDNNN